MKTAQELQAMTLSEIATVIAQDWPKMANATGSGSLGMGQHPANPYWDAMRSLTDIKDKYGLDSGQSIVLYFLSNAASWRGENAKPVREELKRRLRESGYSIK